MRVIFLDRDGVINKYPGDKNYVTLWKNFHFLPKIKQAVANLHKNNFKLFVISNQAGVNKGILSQKKLDFITKNMLKEIEKSKGKIKGVYYCIHLKEENCACRKPKAGLIKIIRRKYHIDIKNSFFIGDTIRDVYTARVAGCRSILVLSGKEKLSNRKNWGAQPDFVFKGLFEAAEFIINNK